MKKYLVLIAAVFIAPASFADSFAPCGNNEYAYVGDTQAQILGKCGQPYNIKEFSNNPDNTIEKIRWVYTQNLYINNSSGIALGVNQGARYSVEFVNNKVNTIYVEGEAKTEYDYCGSVPGVRRIIKQGETMDRVRSQCGNPTLVNKTNEKTDAPPVQVVEYIYQFDPSVPAVIVHIENGVVTAIN
jgi:opacity protein-like surface antigen